MPITSYSFFPYLSASHKGLLQEGEYLKNDIIRDQAFQFTDYSFLVFPYAKAFEGFLTQLFYDVGYISRVDYISNHLRLGKLLSPHLTKHFADRSLYTQISKASSSSFADEVWEVWHDCRNAIFHSHPHRENNLSFEQAEEKIARLLKMMDTCYGEFKV